jgi:hypothetical protein
MWREPACSVKAAGVGPLPAHGGRAPAGPQHACCNKACTTTEPTKGDTQARAHATSVWGKDVEQQHPQKSTQARAHATASVYMYMCFLKPTSAAS